jgi:hypothetical protein
MRKTSLRILLASLAVLSMSCGADGGGDGDGDENPTPTNPTPTNPNNPNNPNNPAPTNPNPANPNIPTRPQAVPAASVDCGKGTADLSGRFLAPNGTTPVAGAYVYIASAQCWVGTNQTGDFSARGLPAGTTKVYAQKGIFVSEASAAAGSTVSLEVDREKVKLGYVPGDYDSIETVLERLGFEPEALTIEQIAAGTGLSAYNALFLNCGVDETLATGTAREPLRNYVTSGGVLYASDFAESFVQASFPGRVTFHAPGARVGTPGPLEGTVLDEGLKRALGKTRASIHFDDDGWTVIDAAPTGTQVLVSGPIPEVDGNVHPYAVQFQEGQGRVTYTSFHYEEQLTEDMDTLLEQMLLAL